MSKTHISISRDRANKCLEYAQSIRSRLAVAMIETNAKVAESRDSLQRAEMEAEQIEWYLGEILQPEQYKRSG